MKRLAWLVLGSLAAAGIGCGAGNSTVGGASGVDGGSKVDAGGGGGGGTSCEPTTEVCGDNLDNDCNGLVDDGFDKDNDGFLSCSGDCDDANPAVNSGATETVNSVDDNCDGKADNKIPGSDFDKDGTPFPEDCNDEEALVGPSAVEVGEDKVDNNCNGQVDEAATACDEQLTGNTADDFAKSMGICFPGATATFVKGDAAARSIRAKFGTQWLPKQGAKFGMLSTGEAKDGLEGYVPQGGKDFDTTGTHPLPSAPRCGTPPNQARDLTELKITMKVPQNAKSFSYQFNFFSAEYPEFVCTKYNDRFIAILESSALDKTKLPPDQCVGAGATPTCNISYDDKGQPVTINNGFFDVCVSASGPNWMNTCTKPTSLLEGTGYEVPDPITEGALVGGATGWLTTKSPVTPGETITLRLIVFDEGDGSLDSAVLMDNFKWDATAVSAPVTEPGGIN